MSIRNIWWSLVWLTAPAMVQAQTCRTFYVDSNTPSGNFARAINDVNTLGCPSGGLNTIIIDNGGGSFGDTVVFSPLPVIARPVQIQLFSPGVGVRHVIRSGDSFQTGIGYGLRATARVLIADIDIVGGSGRAFFGGILLEGGSDNSQIAGVRIENVRRQGIFLAGVAGTEIRRSSHNPVEIYNSGWGVNQDSPAFEPAILVNGTSNTTIYGTFLGVRQDGSAGGNCSYGIEVRSSTGVFIGLNQATINQRNHIGDNGFGGIRILDSTLVNVFGNYLGLAANGQTMRGNGLGNCFGTTPPALPRAGLVVTGSTLVTIGGIAGQGNVIVAGNRGVVIDNSHSVTLRRTLIGQRPSGQSGAVFGDSVVVENGSGSNGTVLIGGTDEQANVIRGGTSGTFGVRLANGIGRTDVRRNAIWGHPSGGIQRSAAPNPPVLTLASADTGAVAGTLTAVPAAGEVDLYADDGAQGRWYLGTLSVPASASGFSGTVTSPEFVAGRQLTATFTRLAGTGAGTSRFSNAQPILGNDVVFRHGFELP
ncbi:MAG: hypothetical protein KF823_09150 [Xanthomonadales bacterium]|nr:hypothetical protein [Xanthomonadales bacterium]